MVSRCLAAAALLLSASGVLTAQQTIPRTADGRPSLEGMWQVAGSADDNLETRFVEGGKIPYLPAAAQQRAKNLQSSKTADPLSKCYMPGVPRIMYLAW